MTSEERHAARRNRRVEKRKQKRLKQTEAFDKFSNMTDMNHLRKSAKLSRAGVSGKASVQKYFMNELYNENTARNKLIHHEDVREGFIEFDIHERGHKRHIRAMHFRERVIQRCLCDYVLIPVLTIPLVYDNGASLKDKGIHFAMFRMMEQLHRHFRKYGTEGYILQTDFSKYFDNMQHQPIMDLLTQSFQDQEVIDLTWQFVKAFGDSSLGIGSQVSQIFAVAYPNRSDHYIKEVARIGKLRSIYGRFLRYLYQQGKAAKSAGWMQRHLERPWNCGQREENAHQAGAAIHIPEGTLHPNENREGYHEALSEIIHTNETEAPGVQTVL